MNNLGLYIQYHSITSLNQTYCALKRLPLLRKKLPASPRANDTTKRNFIYLGLLMKIIKAIFNSTFTLGFYTLIWLILKMKSPEIYMQDITFGILQSFFFINILLGPFIRTTSKQEADWSAHYFLRVFKFQPKAFSPTASILMPYELR
ncbi:MAG: hypothetical protein Q4P30_03750 [Eubacteriales bacterium]|nr:hypothetical protein [Eubacteriales bacterium]